MTMLDIYHDYTVEYRAKYGDKTVILYQNGSFYELIGVNTDTEKYGLDNIKEICDLLNITVTRKNKAIIDNSKSNPYLAGFPLYCLSKYVDILINNGFTIIIVEQTTPPPSPKREVTQIISPSTYIDNINTYDEKNLMTVYITSETDFKTKKKFILVSTSIFDITTSKVYIYENPLITDIKLLLDELYRIVKIYSPKEIVFFGDKNIIEYDELIKFLELTDVSCHNKFDNLPKELFNIKYQNEILKKIFNNTGLLSPIEYCNLEMKPNSIISFIYLINFVYDHNSTYIKNISQPKFIVNDENLILEYNCIKKLNIISNENKSKNSSLLNILNNCKTTEGKRYFRYALLNPISNVDILEKRYNLIELMLNIDQDIQNKNVEKFKNNTLKKNEIKPVYIFENIRKSLENMLDFERCLTKLTLTKLPPFELNSLYYSLQKIIEIYIILKNNNIENIFNVDLDKINNLINLLETTFNIDALLKYNFENISESFFVENYSKKLDDLQKDFDIKKVYFDNLALKLNSYSPELSGFFKVEKTEKEGKYLSITTKRFQTVKKLIKPDFDITIGNYTDTFKNLTERTNATKTSAKISSAVINRINNDIQLSKDKLREEIIKEYNLFCETLLKNYKNLLNTVIDFVSKIDFYTNNAYNSIKYNYTKPSIDKNTNKSYLKINAIRHPIIEQIHTDIPYITNDIHLGIDNQNGLLIYGSNAVGKSSLMKAVGLNIVLAQSGQYVPCSNMVYHPYKSIFTRIPSGDDIFKGQSTFTSELIELRNILKKSDQNSLIIGDELASGSESISAISIIASSIMHLSKINSSFVFATHFHELKDLDAIKIIKTLKIYHLTIHYDSITNDLIFDRKLKLGGGDSYYGLEIAKFYGFDSEFYKNAELIKKHINNESNKVIEYKKSRYNAKKLVSKCEVCNSKEKSLEVHHIDEQQNADINGNISNKFHKNKLHNLVSICTKCHDNIHSDKLIVSGYIKTSNGIKLDINNKLNSNNDLIELI